MTVERSILISSSASSNSYSNAIRSSYVTSVFVGLPFVAMVTVRAGVVSDGRMTAIERGRARNMGFGRKKVAKLYGPNTYFVA
jgi:hypothetical protein